MSSIIQGYEYDIFISYRQKDNKYDGWVTEFVNNLRRELEATFKEDLSVYFDENTDDGLLETHSVTKSLESKLKCLIFIPIISRTYCDTRSFAWTGEFCIFNKFAKEDQFGSYIKLKNGNVTSRILAVSIHDLDSEDKLLIENETGDAIRAVEFIYKEAGVNRPLKPTDNKYENQNKTDYRNQVNKVANAVKEIIESLKKGSLINNGFSEIQINQQNRTGGSLKISKRTTKRIFITTFTIFLLIVLLINYYGKGSDKNRITTNQKAYEWFMKATFWHTREDNQALDSSIFFLKKAIAADSLFASAHAWLSLAYTQKGFWIKPDGGYQELAFVESGKSLFLDPNLAEGHMAKAYASWNIQHKFPHEKVIREFKQALALNRHESEVPHLLAVIYLHLGLMQESFELYKKAGKLNPDDEIIATDFISWYNFTAKQTDLEQLIALYKQTPEHIISPMRRSFWVIALIKLGRVEEAETMLQSALKKDSLDLNLKSTEAILLAEKGDAAESLKRITLCENGNYNLSQFHHVAVNLAEAYALLGDKEKSVKNLTWAADNGFPNYSYFRDDPFLKSLQQYQPYNDLLNKLKILTDEFRKIANE